MPIDRDDRDERIARIDMLLEELRLNTDDLHELAKQARERAKLTMIKAHDVRGRSQQTRRAGKKR